MKFDTVVLGAGMVGVSIAVHLQKRGLSVALVDRKAPGQETSFGNAGLIQREGVYPYAFPRDLKTILRLAGNKSYDVRYHPDALLKLAPFLFSYWRHSHPRRHAEIARHYATLIEHCVTEHRALAAEAGVAELLRPIGWIKAFRHAEVQDRELETVEQWRREFGVNYHALDSRGLHALEPDVSQAFVGGLHYIDADSVSDPGTLTSRYAQYFERLGGQVIRGDAGSLEEARDGWCVTNTQQGQINASTAVVALGPWSGQLVSRFGYWLPMAAKRGYHMHYAPKPGTQLNHPILDIEKRFLMIPMAKGHRLTTGVELADLDAPKTPTQLAAVEPIAREAFPIGERIDDEPWMGRRPCTPDMMPIIGPAVQHRNLWFAFGHAHHGLTLGPVTGRMIAAMVMDEEPFVDPTPFRVDRF